MNDFLTEYKEAGVNLLSPEHISYLTKGKLESNGSIKYRILKKTKNLDPQRKPGDDWIYPSCLSIPLASKIKKPSGGVVSIGVVSNYDASTKSVSFKRFQHLPTKGDGGYFMLYGNNVEDSENWPALELSNKNASNPFRDQSVIPEFERVDEVKESKIRSKKRNFLYDSLDAIRNWTPEEMRIAAAGYNLPELDPDALKDRLDELAEKDTESFYNAIDSIDNKVRAVINLAKSRNIISYSPHENKWFYVGGGGTIVLLERKEGVDEMAQFTNFLKNSPNGAAVQDNLRTLIKNHKPGIS